MTRPHLAAVFCISLFCFLASVKILYAQTIRIAHAHLAGARLGGDPCAGLPVGGACTGGAIYAGTGYSSGGLNPALHYMVTPGGCTDEVCTGAGGTDSVSKAWANNSGTTASNVNTGATDVNNGKLNTAILVNYSPNYTDTDAAHWCTNMNYGGYTNWYLPSHDELNFVLYINRVALGGFLANGYWSSSELNATIARGRNFAGAGLEIDVAKTGGEHVRCIRGY